MRADDQVNFKPLTPKIQDLFMYCMYSTYNNLMNLALV